MNVLSHPDLWLPAVAALLAAAGLTPLVRGAARRFGMVAAPKKDRWHSRPTALLGGVAIFAAVMIVAALQLENSGSVIAFTHAILPASTLLFVIGLVDDIVTLKPYQKLVGQITAASVIVASGLVLPWTSSSAFNSAITMFWLIGITNAVNMLDNMDGLSAGVAAIAAMFLALNFASLGQLGEASVVLILAGALIGFLIYNSHPASIFMGDCGSLFIGFFLASTALLTTTSGRTRSFIPVIAVPVLTLVIPIFDTTFVTLLRKLSGRAASQGGRDHTSHRLVALGLSERRAVWLLYGLATLAGVLAIQVRQWALHQSVMAILGFIVVLTMIGVYLAGVKVYASEEAMRVRPLVSFLVDLSYKRRVFETLLDMCLVSIAWYSAWSLRFGPFTSATDPHFMIMVQTLPVVVALKIVVFLASGVYRGIWRYTSLSDLVGIGRAALLSSVLAAVGIVLTWRTYQFSRGVLVVDLLLLLILMTVSRTAFRVARRLLPAPRTSDGRPVLIYGAGDAGELLLREIFNNGNLGYLPVGFIDDDPKKAGKLIHGLRVYVADDLPAVCERLAVQEVIISTSNLSPLRQRRVIDQCDAIGLPLRMMQIQLARLNSWERDPLLEEPTLQLPEPVLHVRNHGSTQVVDATVVVRPDRSRR
jgi:UDP-GlcNAc:undecaprenyl-phosphate/decaprenyl-phosphate GlcNAc-1-phosphate transferase